MHRLKDQFGRIRPHELDSVEALSESQITTKEDGSKHVQLNFNVKDFKPEELLIKFDRYARKWDLKQVPVGTTMCLDNGLVVEEEEVVVVWWRVFGGPYVAWIQ